jgi:DNA-binding GntR family transcriptional regulator
MSYAPSAPKRSKHALIAQALSNDIQQGKYKVGDLLPSEPELSAAFGVSRHTVRVALRTLQELGLTVSHQGVGTKVNQNQVRARYSYAFDSLSDLLQYATKTRFRVIDTAQVAVNAKLAEYLGCKPDELWWRVRTVRFVPGATRPIAYSEIYIPLAFGAVVPEVAGSRKPIFALIERRFNERIGEVQQDISATALTAEEAKHLDGKPGLPGLEITRRYFGRGRRAMEVARSVHPRESFKYSMRIKLEHRG